jgi:uncharacterized protein
MATTESQLATGLEAIYEEFSNRDDLTPEQMRKQIAQAQAKEIALFVIGRETNVVGTSPSGAVTGTGTII